jgi:hypothetical protein
MATVSTENLLLSLQVDANQALTTLKKVDTQTKQTQQTFTNVGKANRNFGASFQNAGYQIQDFAVQVSGGTDAVRAFSQQAPQLLSAFGLLGVAAGTAVAVFAPLVKQFFSLGDASEEAASALESFDSALSAATKSGGSFDKYAKLLEKADDETRGWVKSIYEAQGLLAQTQLKEATADLDKFIKSLFTLPQGARGGPNPLLRQIDQIQSKLKFDDPALARQIAELGKQYSQGLISATQFNTELLKLSQSSDIAAASLLELTNLVSKVAGLTAEVKDLSQPFDEISVAAEDLTGVDDLLEGISGELTLGVQKWGDWGKAALDAANPDPFEALVSELSDIMRAADATAEAVSSLGNLKDIGVDFGSKPKKQGEEIKTLLQELQTEAGKWSDQFADTLVSGLADGKLAFKDFADYVLQQLARIAISKALEPLFNSFGNLFGGTAGTAAPAGLIATPVNDLPLSREASSAQQMIVGVPRLSTPSPSSSPVTVNVMNYGSDDVEVNERRTSRGIEVDVLIKNAVKSGIAAGEFDKVMATSFGSRRLAY